MICDKTQVSAAGLYTLSFRLEFAAGEVEVDFLVPEQKRMAKSGNLLVA